MATIWTNKLKALNQQDADKVLAYAKEHYKERGFEDYDEQTMGGLEFTEDSLVYTEVLIDRLEAFCKFADEIGAAFPEMELRFWQVNDDNMSWEYIYKNGICTRYEPRMLEFIAADKVDFERLLEIAVPMIETAGFCVKVESEHNSVSFECEAKECEELKDRMSEHIASRMPDYKLLCVVHDLEQLELTVAEYCILNGFKGDWESSNNVIYNWVLTFSEEGVRLCNLYDAILNPVECFKELQKVLRAGNYYNAYTAQCVILAETPYHNQLMELLTAEDKNWVLKNGRISRDIDQVREDFWLQLPDAELEKLLNEIYTRCNI
jgi:hypothetical protein